MKLTLDEAWEKCLAMWKWIDEQCKEDDNAGELKTTYLAASKPKARLLRNCYFCDFAGEDGGGRLMCFRCPARFVDSSFACEDTEGYDYYEHPKAFYRKIVELYKIFKEQDHA